MSTEIDMRILHLFPSHIFEAHTHISHKDLSLSYDASDSIGVKDLVC